MNSENDIFTSLRTSPLLNQPYWNVNKTGLTFSHAFVTFKSTILECKLGPLDINLACRITFKSTILECKCGIYCVVKSECVLLNQPYWNVNSTLIKNPGKLSALLNQPYWNVNLLTRSQIIFLSSLLNQPYWNVNFEPSAPAGPCGPAFKSTILECKFTLMQ